MLKRALEILSLLTLVGSLSTTASQARNRSAQDSNPSTSIVEAGPTLAPFQHVRFCLRYPSDCKSDSTESERIELTPERLDLLDRTNHSVNAAILPISKDYGADLANGWTIAPPMGDCNDYAVTKRHELLLHGLPSKALRLSVVRTVSGIGHLVLVVATTKGDMVLDNLTEAIRPWQSTDYHWLKIQSADDARFWSEVKAPGISISASNQRVRLADR
ncbi:MAG: transglutaminase-like cysteine peptidase [Bradyrhizobium sp.]|nr:transglutaminase-like cysteine peptidase [Bradyrhizobium sp.]